MNYVKLILVPSTVFGLALGPAKEADHLQMNNMVPIQGGTFLMGDVLEEGSPHERPTHQVTVADFYLGRYEVTVEQFGAFVNDTGYKTSAEGECDPDEQKRCFSAMAKAEAEMAEPPSDGSDPEEAQAALRSESIRLYGAAISFSGAWCCDGDTGKFDMQTDGSWRKPYFEQTGKDPVTCVSWTDAVNYCNWLSRKAGLPPAYDPDTGDLLDADGKVTFHTNEVKGYRLPTEAEWEYAARERGGQVRFGNGRQVARPGEINFNPGAGDHPYAEKGQYRKRTSPVGSFEPNSLGLYDMAGNVWEWCSDFVGAYGDEAQVNPYSTTGLDGRRAARGGRWAGSAVELRASQRLGWVANDRCNNIGFRVARSG
ncbi:MAG: formylglycine-generating enzyme family protein [Planctomycetota bacterium]|jgi:formylglycine-generating enzyme required for sulfatase activity